MRSVPAAIAWQLWASCRWVWIALGCCFLVIVALCQVLPENPTAMVVRACLALPAMVALWVVFIMVMFQAEADLAGKETLFPRWMLILPVTTRALVAWPMLFGAGAMLTAWLAIGQFVLRTMKPELPLGWPAMVMIACFAWSQGLAWSPFGLRWLRVIVITAVIGCVVALTVLLRLADLPAAMLFVTPAATIPAAYVVAVRGLSRARRGDDPDWQVRLEKIRGFARRIPRCAPPFRSASQAQRWFEWQMHASGLPLLVGLGVPVLSALIYCASFVPPSEKIRMIWQPATLLLFPSLVAFFGTMGFGAFTSSHKELSVTSSFLATRPMNCADFVRAKFQTALVVVLITYAIVVPVFLLLAICTGDIGGLKMAWDACCHTLSPMETVAAGLIALLLLPALNWRLIADNMFSGLTGRKWIVIAQAAVMVAFLEGLVLVGLWIQMHPQYHEILWASMPCFLGLLAALKLLLAGWVLRMLCRRRLLDRSAANRLVFVWLVAVIALLALSVWLVPRQLTPWPVAISCAILIVPAVRIGLAPLALAWNRHR
jgi:hypothetical protein